MSDPVLHLYEYDLRLRRGIRLGYAKLEHRTGVLVVIKTGDPYLTGLGEAAPAWWAGDEPVDAARQALAAARQWFSQTRPDLDELESTLRSGAALPAQLVGALQPSRAAAAAVATAIADHQARKREQSLTEYLGGTLGPCTTNALIVADDVGDIGNEVARAISLDYRTVKLKVGHNAAETDVARIEAALAAGHGRLRLRLDANRAWQPAEADSVLSKLDPHDIEYIEEPLADADPAQLKALGARFGIALALDESILSDDDIDRFSQACDTIVMKPGRIGGPWAALVRARRAKAAGLRVTLTDSLETCVGRATCLHLARAIGNRGGPNDRYSDHSGDRPIGLAGAALLDEDLAVDSGLMRGAVIEPQGPGLLPLDALRATCLDTVSPDTVSPDTERPDTRRRT